ncbi:Mor transcription activator family protein [Pseudomonas putida]|uniref:Mor transcription activator family protein n=1 Tax=Pseudomonas putida TaxID=303 RepID=UPI002DBE9735|nr:Mor transcription activator family protein [Pseudomonas putida]WRW04698.1 Mor transcription activator family protein [Pseudomonas putida]
MSEQDMFGDEVPNDALDYLQDPEIKAKWPKLLVELIDVIEVASINKGYEPGFAKEHAIVVTRALARYAGGRPLYLPGDKRLERALRDRDIWAEFSGDNADELMAKYKLSARQVYTILAEQRALHRKRVQPSLF